MMTERGRKQHNREEVVVGGRWADHTGAVAITITTSGNPETVDDPSAWILERPRGSEPSPVSCEGQGDRMR